MPISSISKHVGIAIRDRRMTVGLSKEAMTEHVGLHPRRVSNVESGIRNPMLEVSTQIAKAPEAGLPRLLDETQQNREERGAHVHLSEGIHSQQRERLRCGP